MSESSGQSILNLASLTITDHGSASPKAVDRKSTLPTSSDESSSSDNKSCRAPSKEEDLKLLEEEIKADPSLDGYAKERLCDLVDLCRSFFRIKAAADTLDESSSNANQGSTDQVHHHLSECARHIEVSMKHAARAFLGSQQDSELYFLNSHGNN